MLAGARADSNLSNFFNGWQQTCCVEPPMRLELSNGSQPIRFELVNYGSASYGPSSSREKGRARLRYRFRPPVRRHFNPLQRCIWRVQRLLLGDNRRNR